jgi:hypothetical protein
MSLKKSKGADGRVNSENIGGGVVPRKGLSDETTGKAAGTRNIRSIGGRFFNFAGKGRR